MKTVIMIALLGIASADCEAGMSVAYYKDENCKIIDPDLIGGKKFRGSSGWCSH